MHKLVVYYDGACNLCNTTVNKLSKRDIDKNILFLKIQDISLNELPRSKDSLMERMHCKKENEIYSGISAFIEIFSLIKGYKFPLLLMKFANRIGIGEKIYNLVARNRYLLPFNRCSNGKCDI